MQDLIKEAARRAARYLESLDGRSVAPPPEAVERLAGFDVPLQPGSIAPQAVLAELDELGSPATVASAGPRYFGFVIGGSAAGGAGRNWLAGAWDQNADLRVTSPTAACIEAVCRRWLVDLFGLPAGSRHRVRHRGHDGQLQRRWPPHGMPCWHARAGTSRHRACSARRRSRWWSARRCTSACSRR